MFRKFSVIPVAMLLMLALAACGGDDDGGNGGAGPTEVSAELSEFLITVDDGSVPAGDITFNASNVGRTEHELIVMRTDFAPDALVVNTAEAKVDEAASGTVIGEIEAGELPAGADASATFNLAAGSYVLFCNIPAHYGSGMTVGFNVE